MDAAVLVALIAALSSLVLTLWNTFWASREESTKRRAEAKAGLMLYRAPLLDAAADLGARIHNIQCEEFGIYSGDEDRTELAIRSNLYRFARYFAVAEILRTQVGFLEFEQAEATKKVAALLWEVEGVLTSDRFDEGRLMLWREEQRAIGEVSIDRECDRQPSCIGFATFVDEFDKRAERWFRRFRSDLETNGAAASSQRLEKVQFVLQRLVRQLDEEGRYNRLDTEPAWLSRATAASR